MSDSRRLDHAAITTDKIANRLQAAMAAGRTLSQFQDDLRAEGTSLTYLELRTLAAKIEATPPDPVFAPPAVLPPEPPVQIRPHAPPQAGCLASGDYQTRGGARGQWVVQTNGRVTFATEVGQAALTDTDKQLLRRQVQFYLRAA